MADAPDPFARLKPSTDDLFATPLPSEASSDGADFEAPAPVHRRWRPALWAPLGLGVATVLCGGYFAVQDRNKGPRETAVIMRLAEAISENVASQRMFVSLLGPAESYRAIPLVEYERARVHLLQSATVEAQRSVFLTELFPAYCRVLYINPEITVRRSLPARCDAPPTGDNWWRRFEATLPVEPIPSPAVREPGVASAASPASYIPRRISSSAILQPPAEGFRWCKVSEGEVEEMPVARTCIEAGAADVSPPTQLPPPPSPVRCRDAQGQSIVLSGGQSCAANGYADDGEASRRPRRHRR